VNAYAWRPACSAVRRSVCASIPGLSTSW
jgi:hypothetical protein